MNRVKRIAVASAGSGALLGLLLAFPVGAQGQSGGAKPSGATAGAGNSGTLGWPRVPEVQAPTRLPQDTAFGEKGTAASADKAANAAANSQGQPAAEADCAEASAAIAAAGTGGTTGKGQGGTAGATGRAKAAEVVCSGVTGTEQATQRANEHAAAGLEKAQSDQESDDASDVSETPEQAPPQ